MLGELKAFRLNLGAEHWPGALRAGGGNLRAGLMERKQRQADMQKKNLTAAADSAVSPQRGFSRRGFIGISAAAAASFLPLPVWRAAFAQTNAGAAGAEALNAAAERAILPADFQTVSHFLTGKEISPMLAQRAWAALAGHEADFAGRYGALRDFIRRAGAANIDVLKNNKAFQGALRQTALTIISAYYLGYVGTPRPLRAHDDTVFITYTQALMYQLTYERTPIPTYSRWDTGYWDSFVNPR